MLSSEKSVAPFVRKSCIYRNLCSTLERLKMNEWVNLYPEGQVNKKNEWMRFYWGVGRMLYEAPKTKLLPFYHIGLNEFYVGCPKFCS